MPIALTIREVEGLEERLKMLEETNAALAKALAEANANSTRWVLLTEANKHFIGRNGKPLHRNSFRRFVDRMVQQGRLVEGKNLLTSNGMQFISTEFINGHTAYKPKALKMVA